MIEALVIKATLDNDNVPSCMKKEMQRWNFPEPQGNGTVTVDYPFNFSTND